MAKKYNLYEETMVMLHECRRPIAKIARDIHMTNKWLEKVKKGQIKNPGVHSTQKLHDYLIDLKREEFR